jgi:hypothetical protein
VVTSFSFFPSPHFSNHGAFGPSFFQIMGIHKARDSMVPLRHDTRIELFSSLLFLFLFHTDIQYINILNFSSSLHSFDIMHGRQKSPLASHFRERVTLARWRRINEYYKYVYIQYMSQASTLYSSTFYFHV